MKSHLRERKGRNGKKPLKCMQKIQCISGKQNNFAFKPVLHILLNPLHWSSLTLAQKNALQPAAPSSLFHLNGTKGMHRPLVCAYQSVELCVRKQNLKTPDRAQKGYGPQCLKAIPSNSGSNSLLLL